MHNYTRDASIGPVRALSFISCKKIFVHSCGVQKFLVSKISCLYLNFKNENLPNYGMHVRMLLHTQVHRAENTCIHNNNVYVADYATYIM